jgi:hypothetical protein
LLQWKLLQIPFSAERVTVLMESSKTQNWALVGAIF